MYKKHTKHIPIQNLSNNLKLKKKSQSKVPYGDMNVQTRDKQNKGKGPTKKLKLTSNSPKKKNIIERKKETKTVPENSSPRLTTRRQQRGKSVAGNIKEKVNSPGIR